MGLRWNNVGFDLKEVESFLVKYRKLGVNIEDTSNEYLHSEGYALTQNKIYSLMPRSDESRIGKKHAKDSKSLRVNMGNLSFEILPEKTFNYLVFPNDALGTSHLNAPQLFFERGLDLTNDEILQGLITNLERVLERSL